MSNISSVQICESELNDKDTEDIIDVLDKNTLQILSLRDSHVNLEQFKRVARAAGHCRSIRELHFSTGVVTDIQRLRLLCTCLAENASVKVLILEHHPLSEGEALLLFDALKIHPPLASLSLMDCDLTDAAIAGILNTLRCRSCLPGLMKLNLCKNPRITQQGWENLATGISCGTDLQKLNISNNNIGDRGAIAFCVAIAGNRTLAHVAVESSCISQKGGKAFLKLLELFPYRLRELRLAGNDIGKMLMMQISSNLLAPSVAK